MREPPALLLALALSFSCDGGNPATPTEDPQDIDRHERIPVDAVKKTPDTDLFPPVLHSAEFLDPVPLAVINTAGAEDSPFIPADRDEIYFVFIKDAGEPVEIQIRDVVNGIWVSQRQGSTWQEATLVVLQDRGQSLDVVEGARRGLAVDDEHDLRIRMCIGDAL